MRVLSLCGPAQGGMARVSQWLDAERKRLQTSAGLFPVNWPAPIVLPPRTLAAAQIIEAHGWRAGWAGRSLAGKTGLPLVIIAHSFPPQGVQNWLWRTLERSYYEPPAVYVAVSEPLKSWLQPRVRAPIEVLPLVPPVAAYRRPLARRLLGLPGDRLIVGTIGRLAHEKGYDLLLRAWAKIQPHVSRCFLKPPMLSIVGDGPESVRLRQLTEQLHLARSVRWHGYISDAGQLAAAFDVYVQPSRSEGLGLAALEAAGAGVPAVLTNCGGLRQIAAQAAAIVVDADSDSLAAGLLDLITSPLAVRRQIGSHFKQMAAALCDHTASLHSLAQLYHQVADRRSGAGVS